MNKGLMLFGAGAVTGIAVFTVTELVIKTVEEHRQRRQIKKICTVLETLSTELEKRSAASAGEEHTDNTEA